MRSIAFFFFSCRNAEKVVIIGAEGDRGIEKAGVEGGRGLACPAWP